MRSKTATVAIVIAVLGSTASYALDARNPDPISVLHAANAALNVGNVDAHLTFWTDDAYFITTRGKKIAGKEELRRMFQSFVVENVQSDVGPDAVVKGNTITSHSQTSAGFLERLGISPVTTVGIVIIDGNKIKAKTPYYVLSS